MQDQRYREALGHYRSLIKMNKQNLGRYHLHTISTQSGLARCHLALKNIIETREHDQDSVARYDALFGPEHVDTLLARRYLLECAGEAEQYDKTVAIGQDLRAHAKQALGNDDPITAKIAVIIGRYIMSTRWPAEARDMILRWKDRLSSGN